MEAKLLLINILLDKYYITKTRLIMESDWNGE